MNACAPSIPTTPPKSTSEHRLLDRSFATQPTSKTSKEDKIASFQMAPPPKYLSGDKAAINEFIDKFDVRSSVPARTYQAMSRSPSLTLASDLPL
jgi:hypothetical protein